MNGTLYPLRAVFLAVCAAAGWLVCYTVTEWDAWRWLGALIGLGLGTLVVLTDLLLKGFSLRGLSATTFGIAVGTLISHLLGTSPLFRGAEPQFMFLSQLALFLSATYLSTVIALRGKDEFNLVIPYVRFVPTEVDTPLVMLDSSALIDGRVAKLCESGFLRAVLVIPSFVLEELQTLAGAADPMTKARGRRGLDTLAALRQIPHLEIRTPHSEVSDQRHREAKLLFLAQTEQAKLLTLDSALAKMAEFQKVPWLNLHALTRALRRELSVGEILEVDLIKPGKEADQAIGYLEDGSLVVVANGRPLMGKRAAVEMTNLSTTTAGKLVFGRVV